MLRKHLNNPLAIAVIAKLRSQHKVPYHMQRDLLKGFLERKGYEVEEAENGRNVLELFQRLPFQLVLLDHHMPDMNGDELLEKMKAANPLVKAIMITAYGDVDKAVRVLKLGAADFLEKPVDLAELLEFRGHHTSLRNAVCPSVN